jgi:hypothetical protein
VATTRFARLSHRQWENAVRDLLGLRAAPGLAGRFRGDPIPGKFDNNGGTLSVDDDLRRDYREAAERLAELATTGDALGRLLPPNLPSDAAGRARAFVTAFGLRAYRRPLTPAELDRALALFGKGPALFAGRDAFADGVRAMVEAVLQSPHFLYRTELSPAPGPGRARLSSYELAAKLAFTLTGTLPDAALLEAAGRGALDGPALRREAERLLETPAAEEVLEDFHEQLLHMGAYENIEKDPKLFPGFGSGAGPEMRRETLLFARDVVRAGGGIRELLTTPSTFVSRKLASVYGVPGPATEGAFEKVALDPSKRAGLLTQLGFLSVNAHLREIDSIHRGVFVHHAILCTHLPPPADGATLSGAKGTTNRERITSVTGDGTCGAGCHSRVINPVGFAFEHYDAIGRWRATDNGQPVDAADRYVFDDEDLSWTDAVGFSRHAAESRRAHACYARHLLEYAFGRVPAPGDDPLIDRLGESSRQGKAGAKALLLGLVTSDEFSTRAPSAPEVTR